MIAISSNGKIFGKLARYLAAGRSGQERDRVAWSAGRNLPTNDPEIAIPSRSPRTKGGPRRFCSIYTSRHATSSRRR